jgi:hypothetical protein
MNKEQLKELVKQHFGLVEHTPVVTEEKFGEVFDENKAFKIVFPGDTLKVGDEVKVVTTDGQESLAPDGEHRLENGTTIVTEGSSVVSITDSEGKKEEEMKKDEKMSSEAFQEGPKEDISNVEGTTPQNATTVTDASVSELTGPVDTESKEELKKMIKLAVEDEIKSMKDEMKSIKDKFEEFMKSPAKEKTMMSSTKESISTDSLQAKQMKVMAELLKNKK